MVWFRTHLGIRPFFVRILSVISGNLVSESEWEMGIFGPPEKSGRFLSDGILLNALEWLVHWTDLINWSCRVPINDEDTLWNINNRSSLNIKLIESNILIYIITISQVQNSEKPKVHILHNFSQYELSARLGMEWMSLPEFAGYLLYIGSMRYNLSIRILISHLTWCSKTFISPPTVNIWLTPAQGCYSWEYWPQHLPNPNAV